MHLRRCSATLSAHEETKYLRKYTFLWSYTTTKHIDETIRVDTAEKYIFPSHASITFYDILFSVFPVSPSNFLAYIRGNETKLQKEMNDLDDYARISNGNSLYSTDELLISTICNGFY